MGYTDAINYLYSLQKHGIKLGLDNPMRLLSALGKPQNSFPSIHIAGTNGKGSTSVMIASILKMAGYKVGLFTSPHIVSFTERIRVNGEEIAEQEVIELTSEIRDIVVRMEDFSPTFFEFVTAMAFLYFMRKGVDRAVVETGMGGRLDATNVIFPEVSAITSVSCDHKEFLGNSLTDIAREKAGIIKERVPVVTASQEPEVMNVIETKAVEKGSKVFAYGRDFSSVMKTEDIDGITFDYSGDKRFENLHVSLIGGHQLENASVALKTIEIVSKKSSHHASRITHHAIRNGLGDTRWPGRLEIVGDNPPILVDGAHNPAASRAFAVALRKIFLHRYKRIILILGIMGDKDIKGIMEPVLPVASEIILTAPAYGRAATPRVLSEHALSLGFSSRTAGSVADAISMARGLYRKGDLIVITGSFYTIGEAKEVLGQKGVLARLRE